MKSRELLGALQVCPSKARPQNLKLLLCTVATSAGVVAVVACGHVVCQICEHLFAGRLHAAPQ